MRTIAKLVSYAIGTLVNFGIVTLIAFIFTKVGITSNLGAISTRIIIALILTVVSLITNKIILKNKKNC